MTDANPTKPALTARDLEILSGAFRSIKGDVVLDYDRLAELAKFKNGNSARTGWFGMRKKLGLDGKAFSSKTGTPTKGTKRKAAEDDADELADGVDASGSPTTGKTDKERDSVVEESFEDAPAVDGVKKERLESHDSDRPAKPKGKKAKKTESVVED